MKKYFLSAFIALFVPFFVNADMAPTPFNRGGTMFGIEDTMVEMTYEKVVFSNFKIGEDDYGIAADVRADFVMTNLGGEDESMKVYFPFYFRDDLERGYDTVKNIKVLVDGKEIVFKRDEGKNEIYFDTKFKASKKTNVSILYTCNLQEPGRQSLEGWNRWGVEYVLHTGALWKNSIGEGQIIFKFPYSVEDQEKFFAETLNQKILDDEACSPGDYSISGNEMIFNFKNLEPTEKNDIYCGIYSPTDWVSYLKSVDEVRKSPTYKNYLDLADHFGSGQFGSEKKYFENINKALELKYPKKTLEYYEEALKYYTGDWNFYMDGKGMGVYFDLDKALVMLKELEKLEDSSKKTELVDKVKLGLFGAKMADYEYYKYHLLKGEAEPGKILYDYVKDYLGYSQEARDFCLFLEDQKVKYYSEEFKKYFTDFNNGDYSFMDENNIKKLNEVASATASNIEENSSLNKMSEDGQKKAQINEQESRKIQREEQKQSASLIVYILAGIVIASSVGIFIFSKKIKIKD